MGDEPEVSFAGASEEAMELFGSPEEGDGGRRPAPPPEEPSVPEPEEIPEDAPAPETEPAQPEPQAPLDDGRKPYRIGGREYRLSDDELGTLLRHGAQKLQELEEAASRAPEPEPEPEPEPVAELGGLKLSEADKQNPVIQFMLQQQAKLAALEKSHRQSAAQLADQAQRAEAQSIIQETLKSMKKNDFFKDCDADEQHEFLGEILMLRNVHKQKGMTTDEAVRHIAQRNEKKINARVEKWKQGKIAAAGQKVEGAGSTHATAPPKNGRNDLFDGTTLNHAMSLWNGMKSE
jgi:hypothetical protein